MTRRIVVEQAAETDLFEAVAYYRREGSPATARRFVDAAQDTFAQLAQMPDMGRRYQTDHPQLQHLHVWRVRSFGGYLIFSHATSRASPSVWCVLAQERDSRTPCKPSRPARLIACRCRRKASTP